MTALVRGVLRGRISSSIIGRHHYLHSIPNKSLKDDIDGMNKALKDDIDAERMSQDCQLMVVKAVAAEAERKTIAHDSKINPFRWLYGSLGIPSKEFKPSSYWRMHLLFACLLCFSVGMEMGERHAKRLGEEYRRNSSSMSEANREKFSPTNGTK